MKVLRFCCLTLLVAIPAFAQEQNPPRVFITESQSWNTSGGGPVAGAVIVGSGGVITAGRRGRGGARPQTAEIIKTFNERCGRCVVTMNREKADYVVVLDHEGGKSFIWHDNKYALFDKDGDAIKSGSTRSLGTAVKEACEALTKDWLSRNAQAEQPPSQ
jgi:hypothetical protein